MQPADGGQWIGWSLDVAGVRVVAATEDLARALAEARVAKQMQGEAGDARATGRDVLDALARLGWKSKPRSRGRVLRRGGVELPAPMLADEVLEADVLAGLACRFDVPYAALCAGLGRGGRALGPGAVIGEGFRLEAPLGRGGHAEVWRATRGGDAVALKVLRRERAPHLASYVTRFAAEADKLARVASAHVPRLHGAGFDADAGTPYIAMDLARGQTVAALRRGPGLPVARALRIGAQVARALADLGAAGLAGNDPHHENVMVDATAGDHVTVIDLDRATLAAGPIDAMDLRRLPPLVLSLVRGHEVPAALRRLCERLARGVPERARDVARELAAMAGGGALPAA